MRYKTLPIGLLAAISIINSTVLPASANPRRTRQNSYEACMKKTHRDFRDCAEEAGEETFKNGTITFMATEGNLLEKAGMATRAAVSTLVYDAGKCFYEYNQYQSSCESKARQRRSRKGRQRQARRRYRRRTSRRLRRANY